MGERKYVEMCWLLRILGKHNHGMVFDLVVVFMTGQCEEVEKDSFFFFEKVAFKFKSKL